MMISQSKETAGQDVSPLLTLDLNVDYQKGMNVERLEFAIADIPGLVAAVSTEQDYHADFGEDETQTTPSDSMQSASEKLAEDMDAALERGKTQGRDDARTDFERQLAEVRAHVLKCCADFQQATEEYFASMEGQVVKLVLEIAKRVLYHEVRTDPMVLKGVVNAALTKVRDESGTILRVPLEDTESWRQLFLGHESFVVEVRGETQLAAGECILDTRVGKVELGVAAQMEEIEKAFSDVRQQRSA